MSHSCRLLCGFLMSCIGWTGIIIATSTNDWVVTCKYNMHTCRKMDELETKGLWTECVISTALYHCISLNQILDIPGEKEFFGGVKNIFFCMHPFSYSWIKNNSTFILVVFHILIIFLLFSQNTFWFVYDIIWYLTLWYFDLSLHPDVSRSDGLRLSARTARSGARAAGDALRQTEPRDRRHQTQTRSPGRTTYTVHMWVSVCLSV